MGELKQKLATIVLVPALICAMSIPCFAESTGLESAGIGSASSLSADKSFFVPLEHTEMELNGEMVVTELFDVPASLDPDTLVKQGFALKGYFYSFSSITKDPYTQSHTKEVELEFSDTVDSANLSDNISKLPATMEYDISGYVGTLHLDPRTISIDVAEQETKNSTKKEVKTYNLEFNDPTQLPQSYNGLPLSSYTYTDGPYIEGSSVPQYYIYTATYSKTTSLKVDSSWTLSALYTGTATYDETGHIQYLITYKGEQIPEGAEVIDGTLVPKGYSLVDGELVRDSTPNYLVPVLGCLLLLFGLALAIYFILYALKHGLIYSKRIVVQAQDDSTGDYRVIQKAKVSEETPTLTIDTMQAPASRHFLCTMSPLRAKDLNGKIITVFADGQVVCKHRVEPLSESDKYLFAVDLDPVEAGPLDALDL